MINTYPQLLVEYATEYCKKDADWKIVLAGLLKEHSKLNPKSSENDFSKCELLFQSYKNTLNYLAHLYDPQTFLGLLPSNGNISFFIPFILRSISYHKSNLLKNLVAKSVLQLEEQEPR